MVKLVSYGAAEEVTGSKHLLEAGRTRILVDCGVFQGRRADARRRNREFPFSSASVDHCINTHGHLDHCGAYPLLVKNGFQGEILSTSATRDIAGLVMMDSAKIMANDVRFLEKKKKKYPERNIKIYEPL